MIYSKIKESLLSKMKKYDMMLTDAVGGDVIHWQDAKNGHIGNKHTNRVSHGTSLFV